MLVINSVFLYFSSTHTLNTKHTSGSVQPIAVWTVLGVPPNRRQPVLLVSPQLHRLTAELPTWVCRQHWLPLHASLYIWEVSRSLRWLLRAQRRLPSTEPHPNVYLRRRLHWRSFHPVFTHCWWVLLSVLPQGYIHRMFSALKNVLKFGSCQKGQAIFFQYFLKEWLVKGTILNNVPVDNNLNFIL